MFNRIINLLVIEDTSSDNAAGKRDGLTHLLHTFGNNVFTASSNLEALKLLNEKEFVVIFLDVDLPHLNASEFIKLISSNENTRNATLVITSSEKNQVVELILASRSIPIDYLIKPYIPNLVKAKIDVYKKLHYRHVRVTQLLENILPSQTLSEFGTYGKSSPKRKKNCSVLFTDFVNFTQKTKNSEPEEIVKELDYYFSRFDEIVLKYKLEKIKTIGDAYMATAGVTEKDAFPAVRTALAAMEIQNFMEIDEMARAKQGKKPWDIRIGIHCGDLVAGVVGTQKFSFDVWGDTVNIAARCEQHSAPGKINVSEHFFREVTPFFEGSPRGHVPIKNGGEIEMYFIDRLKSDYSLHKQGKIPNGELRLKIGLPKADFNGLRNFAIEKLKTELDPRLVYHSPAHTLAVESAVLKYAELEKLSDHELFLVQTAAIFHDTGFLIQYDNNEEYGVQLLREFAPQYGYEEEDLAVIETLILSTAAGIEPSNLLEKIMADADLDYLGRPDYHYTADLLFEEMDTFVTKLPIIEKLNIQLDYLENKHNYYTVSARNVRNPGKQKRIKELKKMIKSAQKKSLDD